jgi:hypothetical protein
LKLMDILVTLKVMVFVFTILQWCSFTLVCLITSKLCFVLLPVCGSASVNSSVIVDSSKEMISRLLKAEIK